MNAALLEAVRFFTRETEIMSGLSVACGDGSRLETAWDGLEVEICPVRNDFFGEMITVSGLITGQDLIRQLKGRDLGDCLLIPCSMLRAGEEVFLDDVTVTQVSEALQVPVRVTAEDGEDFCRALFGETVSVYNWRKQNYEQTDCGCRGTAECGEIDPV